MFSTRAGPRPCPVKGYSGRALTRMATRVHIWHWHVRDTVVILEECNLPHTRCNLCDMMVTRKGLNGMHRRMAHCTWGAERKRQQLLAEEEREVTARAFSSYGSPLEMLTSFNYLGRVISEADNDWTVVVSNLSWEKKVWRRMLRIISREGVAPQVSGVFFKAVIQAVLLFRA